MSEQAVTLEISDERITKAVGDIEIFLLAADGFEKFDFVSAVASHALTYLAMVIDALEDQRDVLRAENETLRLTLESEPLASVMKLANKHYCAHTWQFEPESRWLAGLVEKIGELATALHGRHEHTPDVELRQIASIALNWLSIRRAHGA